MCFREIDDWIGRSFYTVKVFHEFLVRVEFQLHLLTTGVCRR